MNATRPVGKCALTSERSETTTISKPLCQKSWLGSSVVSQKLRDRVQISFGFLPCATTSAESAADSGSQC
jgi:hypothetical protein